MYFARKITKDAMAITAERSMAKQKGRGHTSRDNVSMNTSSRKERKDGANNSKKKHKRGESVS